MFADDPLFRTEISQVCCYSCKYTGGKYTVDAQPSSFSPRIIHARNFSMLEITRKRKVSKEEDKTNLTCTVEFKIKNRAQRTLNFLFANYKYLNLAKPLRLLVL